jgi:hypothetical protein
MRLSRDMMGVGLATASGLGQVLASALGANPAVVAVLGTGAVAGGLLQFHPAAPTSAAPVADDRGKVPVVGIDDQRREAQLERQHRDHDMPTPEASEGHARTTTEDELARMSRIAQERTAPEMELGL